MGSGTITALPLLPAGVSCWSHRRVRPHGRAGVPHAWRCTNRRAPFRLAHPTPAHCQPHAAAPPTAVRRAAGPLQRASFSVSAADTLSRPDKDHDDFAAVGWAPGRFFDELARSAGELWTGGAALCWTFAG